MIPDGVRNAARYPTRFGWIQNSFGIAQSDADLTAGYDKQMVVPMSMHFNGASAARFEVSDRGVDYLPCRTVFSPGKEGGRQE